MNSSMLEEMAAVIQASNAASQGGIFLTNTSTEYNGPAPGLPLIKIETQIFSALFSVQGAQLLSFQPAGDKDWLWLSPVAKFQQGKAIRGGVPICAPWFGPHPTEPDFPKHGFVRNQDWSLVQVEFTAPGEVKIEFGFDWSDEHAALCADPFSISARFYLGREIRVEFVVENKSTRALPLTWALHSYFAVSDIAQVAVKGLETREYVDTVHNNKRVVDNEVINFTAEVDRVYESVPETQAIVDNGSTERTVLLVSAENAPTAIVWNPGAKLAAKMDDVGKAHFNNFICVERGAAWGNKLELLPQSSMVAVMKLCRGDK